MIVRAFASALFVALLLTTPCMAEPPKSAPEPRDAVVALAEEIHRQGVTIIYKEKEHAALLYLGTQHTYKPDDEEVEPIEKFVAEFKPTLMVIEGGVWPLAENKTQAVRRYGELGFARFLAGKNNIKWKTFGPTIDVEMAEVLKAHSASDAKLYYALRMVPHWVAQESATSLEQKMSEFLSTEKSATNFGKAFPVDTRPRTIAELTELCAATFPELPDWRKIGFSYKQFGKKPTTFSAVQKTSRIIRSRVIEKEIMAAVEKGERVMVLSAAEYMNGTVSPILTWLSTFD